MASRRDVIRGGLAACAAGLLPGTVFADVATDARFVLVLLRGALDGLAAVPAYGDGSYATRRGPLAITAPQLRLDGTFALHPSLENLHRRFQAKELIVFHAVASAYRERSHFDGQDLLENGMNAPVATRDGWLNRALQLLPDGRAQTGGPVALAIARNVPLVLRGDARTGSWAPSRGAGADPETLERITDLYSTDPWFASRLQAALVASRVAGAGGDGSRGGRPRNRPNALPALADAAGKFLAAADGPRIAVVEAGGWDTHARQGAEEGQLANRLRDLDQALESLRASLGAAWARSAVLVVTEFGRTVAVNGTAGTDHGTATCAFLVGGAVAGGRVVTDWPGLSTSALYEGRDLRPTMDLRSILKGLLAAHLGVTEGGLDTLVFPGSRAAGPLHGLIRT